MNEQLERDKASYEQNFEQFRSLNQVMWQVPLIAMTLTGGLWFGVATMRDMREFQIAFLGFAALADVLLIAVLCRVRAVMDAYLKVLSAFNPNMHVDPPEKGRVLWGKYAVRNTWIILLAAAGLISVIGIWIVTRPQGIEVLRGNMWGGEFPY